MVRETPERRLAAILVADIVDYSRLMGEDEVRTLAALAELRSDLFEPAVTARSGKVIKRMGDGWIVEYPNISDATASAIEIQEKLQDHEIFRLRVGVHIGDVTVQNDDIYGDGINVAARLEALAQPGQVLISDTAHHSLDGKAAKRFSGGKQHDLKNIARPVAVWYWPPGNETTTAEQIVRALPDKPSIAVLAFENMSGDLEQEYFADGIAEDLITTLSKFHWFMVIARNSSFTYKGSTVNISDVGRELGARYVIEGSVRKAGNRIRVSAQLIEASTGGHIWADRYDREITDIFQLQDDITESIVTALAPEFETAEIYRSSQANETDLTIWDLVMKARWHLGQYHKDASAKAQDLLYQALKLDAHYPPALSLLAINYWVCSIYNWGDSVDGSRTEALEIGQRAVALDNGDAMCHVALGLALSQNGNYDEAIKSMQQAVRLNPNLAAAHGWLGLAQTFACQFDDCVGSAQQAMRLSPRDLDRPFWMSALSFAAFANKRYEEAIKITTIMLTDKPNLPTALRHRAAALAMLGRIEEAQAVIQQLLIAAPETTIAQVHRAFAFSDPDVATHWLGALRQAGLTEE